MKERVSIRRNTSKSFIAVNSEAIGKDGGVVFSIVCAALGGDPLVPARAQSKRARRG